MLTIIRRTVLPVILLIVGFASLLYGAKFHHVPVLVEQKSEVTIDVPLPFSPDMQQFPDGQPFQGPPQFRKETVTKTELLTINEYEPALLREVTVGGIAWDESHNLKRTYSGKPPSLCPT